MALKIYFCDGCNESIPLKDINENRITIDAGKIFCAKCAPKNPVRGASKTSPAAIALLVALLGLGFGLIAYITSQRLGVVDRDLGKTAEAVDTLRSDVEALRRDALPREVATVTLGRMDAALDAVRRDVASQAEKAKVGEGALRAELEGAERRISDALRTELTALAKRLDAAADEDRRHAAGEAALKSTLANIEAAVAQLRADLEAVKALRVAAGGAGNVAEAEDDVPTQALLASLKDPDDNRRFEAINELARLRTWSPSVVTAIEEMLDDPASHVRDAGVRALGKIKAPATIPALIGALRDADFFVRVSARDALKAITKQDLSYDPAGDAPSREAKVREWEGWWQLNGERLAGGK